MEIKPVEGGAQQTPIRVPDRLEVKEDGTVLLKKDTVEIKKGTSKAKKSPLEKVVTGGVKTVLTGVGFGSGLVGGGIIGAGVGASGGLIQGLANSSLSWAGVSGAGLVGGVIGAAIFGLAGAYGGWTFSNVLIKGGKFMVKLLFTKEPLSEAEQAAFDRIKEVEDNPKDAMRAVRYLSGNLSADEDIGVETGLYIGLLNHFGNKKSDMALSAYATIRKFLPPGAEREEALSLLGRLKESFNGPEAAMDALYAIFQNLNAKDSLSLEGERFRKVTDALRECSVGYGVVSAGIASEAYKLIKVNFPPEERDGAIASTLGKFKEYPVVPEVALANLRAIIECRYRGEDLGVETRNLLDLVKKFDGDAESAGIAYRVVKTNFGPSEREEGYRFFVDLNETEKSAKAAAKVLEVVKKGLYNGERLSEQLDFYKRVRGVISSSSKASEKALAAYKTIVSSFRYSKREDALVQFEKLAASETAVGQDSGNASDDLAFLIAHMSRGEKFGTEMEKFIGYLLKTKSSSKAQRAYLDSKYKEI